jgi:hypothetical protein
MAVEAEKRRTEDDEEQLALEAELEARRVVRFGN